MRAYKNKEELKAEIGKTFEKYISEFDNIPESLKDKRVDEVDRTPAENIAYQVGWTTLILKWEEDEKKGLEVRTPSENFKWNKLDELYQWFTDTYAHLSLQELKGKLNENINSIYGLNFDDEPVWKRIISEETFLSEEFSPRFKQTVNLLTDKDVDIFLRLLELVVLDSDEEYYLYAPVTDEEVELYKKYGIGDREFFSMKEAGLINLGERVDNKLTTYDSDFCGFQNDNLVVAIQAEKIESYQLNYKSYAFTQVGLDLLGLAEIETSDLFFTELAKLVKQNYANAPVKVHLFSVEDIEDAEDIEMVDFSKDILQ